MKILLRESAEVSLVRDATSDEYQVYWHGDLVYGNNDYTCADKMYRIYTDNTVFNFKQAANN